ncbi:elongator complex protein 1-like [Corticium candelabrum]|uniref:elongator complex protein 1-like n=1 Tax=Corticium candelabrum TaxID=121492 RepID=UPI002E277208|nr:elongator complex protein 1-like [Corticium candelabrum]
MPNSKVQNASCFTVCAAEISCISVVVEDKLVSLSVELEEVLWEVSLVDGGYLQDDGNDRVVGLEYVTEHDAVCVTTLSGHVLLCSQSTKQVESMGSVHSGLRCMSWSPDQEVVVFITGASTLILMSKDFDPLLEVPIQTDEFGEGAFVNVGWGKKETQFHGSEGKPDVSADKGQNVGKVLAWDDRQPRVSWRGDGQYFVCSTINVESGSRELHVYNREGTRQSTSEPVDGLEGTVCWKPSGSLIASSQYKPHRHDVIFFEKNGLRHGEFTLPFARGQAQVRDLQWNADSSILAIWLEVYHKSITGDVKLSTQSTVQMWSVGNYHWYLKQEFVLSNEKLVGMVWDPELVYKIHFLLSDGRYMWKEFRFGIDQSKGHCSENNSTVAVIDGAKLLLTSLRHQVVPPPMAAHTINMSCCVNQIAFSPPPCCDDILVLTSDNILTLLRQTGSHSGTEQERLNGFQAAMFPPCVVASATLIDYSIRHLKWWKADTFLSIAWQSDSRSDCLMEFGFEVDEACKTIAVTLRHKCLLEMPVLQLEANADTQTVVVEFINGSIVKYHSACKSDNVPFVLPWTMTAGQDVCFPLPAVLIETAIVGGEEVVLGLSDWARFFVNNDEIVQDCTSFAVHDEFILLTTHSHTCRFVPLSCSLECINSVFSKDKSSTLSESIRRIERGSRIVSVVSGDSKLVLQMPRGNLETICPRTLLLTHVRKQIDSGQYGAAFTAMRKHRINMNLLYDHNPNMFLESLDAVIGQLKTVDNVNLFLSDLRDEDVTQTMYPGWSGKPSLKIDAVDKVDRVCNALREKLEKANSDKFMLSILMTHIKKTKPELKDALFKIQTLHHRQPEPGCVSAVDALKFVTLLIDVNELYDVALGTYDLNLVVMVAEQSQKDPKEYLPFLNELRYMTNYDKYRIDRYLKRYKLALEHISKCGTEKFEESLELIKQQGLYMTAFQLFQEDATCCKAVAAAYGKHLVVINKLEEAGLVLCRYGLLEESLDAFEKCGSWRRAFAVAFQLKLPQAEILRLARSLGERLKGMKKYSDASQIFQTYASDPEEAVVCLLSGTLWDDALRLIHTLERTDLIETHLRPALLETGGNYVSSVTSWSQQFEQHRLRLIVVREEKSRAQQQSSQSFPNNLEEAGPLDSDLYSDTISVSERSYQSSNYSKSTARSSKNRRKAERKKHRLKEGSPHEESALLEALEQLWNAAHGLRDDVRTLLQNLYLFEYDVLARNLQSLLYDCLDHMVGHKEQIWTAQVTQSIETGPWMSSNDIAAAAAAAAAAAGKSCMLAPTLDKRPWRSPGTGTVEWMLPLLDS